MTNNAWSFWLRRDEAKIMPTFDAAYAAMQHALPGFVLQSKTVLLEGGNPRDGYLHLLELEASNKETTITAEFGIYSTPSATLEDDAQYTLNSICPSMQSAAPWNEQCALWQAVAHEFARLGFSDSTLKAPVFVDALLTLLRDCGENVEFERILSIAQKSAYVVNRATLDLSFTGYYDRDALFVQVVSPLEIAHFRLDNCRTNRLPENFSLLRNLISVSLARNSFVDVPEEIMNLPHLTALILDGNPLTENIEELRVRLPNATLRYNT